MLRKVNGRLTSLRYASKTQEWRTQQGNFQFAVLAGWWCSGCCLFCDRPMMVSFSPQTHERARVSSLCLWLLVPIFDICPQSVAQQPTTTYNEESNATSQSQIKGCMCNPWEEKEKENIVKCFYEHTVLSSKCAQCLFFSPLLVLPPPLYFLETSFVVKVLKGSIAKIEKKGRGGRGSKQLLFIIHSITHSKGFSQTHNITKESNH